MFNTTTYEMILKFSRSKDTSAVSDNCRHTGNELSNAEVFIFENNDAPMESFSDFEKEHEKMIFAPLNYLPELEKTVDVPFPITSYEYNNRPLIRLKMPKEIFPSSLFTKPLLCQRVGLRVWGFVVVEEKPKEMDFVVLYDIYDLDTQDIFLFALGEVWHNKEYYSNLDLTIDDVLYTICTRYLINFNKRLESENVGVIKVNKRLKIKHRGEKKLHKIKKLFYVIKNRGQAEEKGIASHNIDWQHSWSVRGHWRKIDKNKIGKDRGGEYCVEGHTWIKNYIKGDGELVKKTRLVA